MKIRMEINFDMDGTIADLYGVEGWLMDLQNSNTRPYEEAKPMFNFSSFARQIHRLQKLGYKVNIITWLSKTGTPEYNEAVADAKLKWLSKHLPSVEFDNIAILEYGTPKENFGKGILFDDEEKNRINWKGNSFTAEQVLEILRVLR